MARKIKTRKTKEEFFKTLEVMMKLAGKEPYHYSGYDCWYKVYRKTEDKRAYSEKGLCSGNLIIFESEEYYCVVCEKHKLNIKKWERV